MPTVQDLVTTHRRIVKKIDFNNESAAATIGVTGSAFNSSGLAADLIFTNGITNNTAAMSRVMWTTNSSSSGYNMRWGPSTASGATAFMCFGPNCDFAFEKMTIHNNATTSDGTFIVTPTATMTGTVIVEFVL